MKNILMINTARDGGGASDIMNEIGRGLSKKLWKVEYITATESKLWRLGRSALTADDLSWGSDITKSDLYKKADIVHLHNLHGGYFPLRLLPKISHEKKLIWTLHDLWAIQPKSPVDGSDSLLSYPPMLWDHRRWLSHEKNRIYKNIKKMTVVAPSRWLFNKLQESPLNKFDLIYLPHGIDTTIYKPGNQNQARQSLFLPRDKKVVLFAAAGGAKNPYKGWEYAAQAARDMPNVIFLCVGGLEKKQVGNVYYYPYADKKDLARYYQSADAYLAPSLHELFGLTTANALASGLPIIAFRTDALPELVHHGENGYLSNVGDIVDMEKELIRVLSLTPERRKKMTLTNRARALKYYSLPTMIHAYEKIYRFTR